MPRTPRRVSAAVTTVPTDRSQQPARPNTSNDVDVPIPDASIRQDTIEVARSLEPYRPGHSRQAAVFSPVKEATEQSQHGEQQPEFGGQTSYQDFMLGQPEPAEPDLLNLLTESQCAPDPDVDLSFFLAFGETDVNANLDWARFFDSPSSDLQFLEQHIDGSNRLAGVVSSPLTTEPVTILNPHINNMPAHGFSTDLSRGAEIANEEMTLNSLPFSGAALRQCDWQANGNHPRQFKAFDKALDNSAGSLRPIHNVLRNETKYWNICQCTPPPSDTAPIRSGESIAHLRENLGGSTLTCGRHDQWRQQNFLSEEFFQRVPLSESARERLLVITQTFFRWASELYNLNSRHARQGISLHQRVTRRNPIDFLLLPPTPVLHSCLERFLTSFEPYYPLVSEMTLDVNCLVTESSDNMPPLLLSLMTTYGMMRDEDPKGQRLAAGMIELCKVALTNLVERETEMPRSNLTFHCAMLCIFEAAFSGDKYLMDFSQGQKYIYLGVSNYRSLR